MRWSFSNEDDGNKKGKKSNKSSIKPRGGGGGGGYFKHIWGGGGLIWEGGQFNLANTMVSVLHEELKSKVEKLKYKK